MDASGPRWVPAGPEWRSSRSQWTGGKRCAVGCNQNLQRLRMAKPTPARGGRLNNRVPGALLVNLPINWLQRGSAWAWERGKLGALFGQHSAARLVICPGARIRGDLRTRAEVS